MCLSFLFQLPTSDQIENRKNHGRKVPGRDRPRFVTATIAEIVKARILRDSRKTAEMVVF